jgi:hypothetical protein
MNMPSARHNLVQMVKSLYAASAPESAPLADPNTDKLAPVRYCLRSGSGAAVFEPEKNPTAPSPPQFLTAIAASAGLRRSGV